MRTCPIDYEHQLDIAVQYGALMKHPFEEMEPGDQDCVLKAFSHSKNCSYHRKGWYMKFVDFLENRMPDVSNYEFSLLRRNIEVIFQHI